MCPSNFVFDSFLREGFRKEKLVLMPYGTDVKKFHPTSQSHSGIKFIFVGSIITFSLILAFNFILPVFFNELRYIPLAPVFIFPFIAFTAYAIYRHKFLDIKIVATETVAFLLTASTFFEVVFAKSQFEIIFNYKRVNFHIHKRLLHAALCY